MEEERTIYLHRTNISSNESYAVNNVTDSSVAHEKAPWLSTETCAYIQGGILFALFFAVMSR